MFSHSLLNTDLIKLLLFRKTKQDLHCAHAVYINKQILNTLLYSRLSVQSGQAV